MVHPPSAQNGLAAMPATLHLPPRLPHPFLPVQRGTQAGVDRGACPACHHCNQ